MPLATRSESEVDQNDFSCVPNIHSENISVSVRLMSGDIIWGPDAIDPNCTVASLIDRVAQTLCRPKYGMVLFDGQRRLGFSESVVVAGVVDGAELNIVFSTWPLTVDNIFTTCSKTLEPFLEKAPQWQALHTGSQKAMDGFVRAILKQLPRDALPPTIAQFVLGRLDLPSNLSQLPDEVQAIAHEIDNSAERVEKFVQAACAVKWPCVPRLLTQWPKKIEQQTAVALLIAARIFENHVSITPESPLRNEEIDLATQSLFRGRADCPLIRRLLLDMNFLVQKPLFSGSSPEEKYLNFDEVWQALPQNR